MVIKITWPRDVGFDLARLRAHADWFKRQVARDPRYGASRFKRTAQGRTQHVDRIDRRLDGTAVAVPSRSGSAL